MPGVTARTLIVGLALLGAALMAVVRESGDAPAAPTPTAPLDTARRSRLIGALSLEPDDVYFNVDEAVEITEDDEDQPLEELRVPLPPGMSRSFQRRDEPAP